MKFKFKFKLRFKVIIFFWQRKKNENYLESAFHLEHDQIKSVKMFVHFTA